MRHSSRATLGVVSILLAGLAVVGPGPASATVNPVGPVRSDAGTPGAGRIFSDGDRVVERARRALVGGSVPDAGPAGPAPMRPRIEATMALRELFSARPTLDAEEREAAGAILARPTDGRSDPYGDGYGTRAVQTCGPHVCVHWVRTTSDKPRSGAWARTTLRVMEQVWTHHVTRLGYRRPASDRGRGGNAKFDVYLKELGSAGLFGYCAPERLVPGTRDRASGYCVLDNDFARAQYGRAPKDTLRVTAAHEFFHAIQYNYDYDEDQWFLESTATWMEDQFADDVDDNRNYLRYGQVRRPQVPLDRFDQSGFTHYGNWPFWTYLSERYGRGVVRRVIERAGTGGGLPDDYSIQAVARVLAAKGGLRAVFNRYAAGNTVASRTYSEGRHFPSPVYVARKTLSAGSPRLALRTRIDHLAAKDVRLTPAGSLGRGTRLRIRVDGPRAGKSPAASVIVRQRDGSLVRRTVKLSAKGTGSTTVRFSGRSVSGVTVTLVNASTRYTCHRGTTYSCAGRAKDDGQVFHLDALVVR